MQSKRVSGAELAVCSRNSCGRQHSCVDRFGPRRPVVLWALEAQGAQAQAYLGWYGLYACWASGLIADGLHRPGACVAEFNGKADAVDFWIVSLSGICCLRGIGLALWWTAPGRFLGCN